MNLKKIFGILSILVVLFLLILLLVNNKEDIDRIKNIKLSFLILISVLTLLEFYMNGLMLKVLLEPFNIKTRLKEWLGLAIVTTFGNYLTFLRGGTATKAVYLKNKYSLSYPHFLATAGASYIITVFVYGILGMLFSIIMLLYSKVFNLILFLLFLAVFTASFIMIFLSPRMSETKNKLLTHIYNIFHGWHILRKNLHFVAHFAFLSLILYLISTTKIFLLYKSLSYNITFISSAFITLVTNLSVLISFTPAGLGVREAFFSVTSNILNLGLKSGIYVSTLDRAVAIVLISILGPIFTYILLNKKVKNPS